MRGSLQGGPLTVMTPRYADADGGPVVEARMRLGHRMLLDLRSTVQLRAYLTGWFDDDLVSTAQQLMTEPGSVALDVGANVGLWTLPLARRAAELQGMVFAFEPVPSNLDRLHDNLSLNDVQSATTVVPKALSDRHGTIIMALREEFASGSSTGNASVVIPDGQDERFPTFEAQVAPLDSIDDLSAKAAVAVMKIDAEGHEDHILRGARKTIARSRPLMFVEWNTTYHVRRGIVATEHADAALADFDYKTVRKATGGWEVDSSFSSPRPIDNLIMAPAERLADVLFVLPAA